MACVFSRLPSGFGLVALFAGTVAALFGSPGCSSAPAKASLPAHCSQTPADEVPDDLVCTGLYSDVAAKTVSTSARTYAPAVALWSDGYDKDRYIQLPDGAKIDANNVDDWKFPVGTKAWKEFRKGDRKIETRFFHKIADNNWLQASYVWSEDGQTAVRGEGKTVKVDGEDYKIPKTSDCNDCHRGRKDKLLGFEAISLAQDAATGVTLKLLAEEKRIEPVPSRTSITLPDPGVGVLHVNCGVTCHNSTPTATALATQLRMRLAFDDIGNKPIEEWDSYKTLVNVDARMPGWDGEVRIVPGAPETSLIVTVMRTRGDGQMPPLATKVVDESGVSAVEGWIRSLAAGGSPTGPRGPSAGSPDGGAPGPGPGPGPGPAPTGTNPPPPLTTCAGGGVAEVEANDAPASATAIGSATNFCGAIASAADNDYFSFTLPADAKSFNWNTGYTGGTSPTVTWSVAGEVDVAVPKHHPGQVHTARVRGALPMSYSISLTIHR